MELVSTTAATDHLMHRLLLRAHNRIPIANSYYLNIYSRSMPLIALLPTDYYHRQVFLPGAEYEAHACVLRHLRRCSRCTLLTFSHFPVNRQSFRTFHLPQVNGILPALSAKLFGVCSFVTYIDLVCFGGRCLVSLCLLRLSFLCFFFFGKDVVWCVFVCVTYKFAAFGAA